MCAAAKKYFPGFFVSQKFFPFQFCQNTSSCFRCRLVYDDSMKIVSELPTVSYHQSSLTHGTSTRNNGKEERLQTITKLFSLQQDRACLKREKRHS